MKVTPQETQAAALTIAAFCVRYGVSRTRVWGEISAGRLPARNAGRNTLISVEDGDKWFASLPAWKPTGGRPGRKAKPYLEAR